MTRPQVKECHCLRGATRSQGESRKNSVLRALSEGARLCRALHVGSWPPDTVRESISAVRSRVVGDTLLWQLKGTNASRRCRELLRRFGVCHPPGTGLLLQGASAHDGTGRTEHTRSALAPVTGHPTAINRQRCRDARRVTAESAPRKHTAKIN